MNIREFAFIPEDKEKPIKVIYEDNSGFVKTNDCTIEYIRRLTPMESEAVLMGMFGTADIGVLDCSDMTDEEIDRIVDAWNSIPEEYLVPIEK